MPPSSRLRILPAALLLLAACEKPFEPIAPSDLVFSIYGHLDAAADTQWVRVMPMRASLETSLEPIDAVVTLEELETGTRVTMRDSTFRYLPLFGDVELYAHNFSTTMPIVPGRHYRLTATRSDGATASATVLIPVWEDPTMVVTHAFRRPGVANDTTMAMARGNIRGTRHLGMALGREDIVGRPPFCETPFPVHQQFLPVFRPAATVGDDHGVQLSWIEGTGTVNPPTLLTPDEERPAYVAGPPPNCILGPKRILAIASGAPWIYHTDTRLREQTHLTGINNIEGRGLGFFAGVQTHVFPFARCVPIDRATPCTITYSPRSVTVVGIVTNDCTGEGTRQVLVRFTRPTDNAIRTDTTDSSGVFQFQGLEPDVAITLSLFPPVPPPPDPYGARFRDTVVTVTLGQAEVDTVAVELRRRLVCGV